MDEEKRKDGTKREGKKKKEEARKNIGNEDEGKGRMRKGC